MKGLTVLFLLLLLFATGCGRKSDQASSDRLQGPASTLKEYGGVMGNALKKARSIDVLVPLRQTIETFKVQEGRYPASLEELVEKKYLPEMVKPPAGSRL
ncbi:MAG TPA: hypothetical protein PKN80_05140, partial [bacterium]|nr:hypothetical protein [bacterium]